MSTETVQAGGQTCSTCGQSFPSWSMFCTHCGKQTVDSVPGSTELSAMAVARGPREPAVGRTVRTRSSTHGTYAIVWTICGWVLCLLFWIPAFSQAKKSRQRGEAIADTATNVVQIGFFIWLVVQIAAIAFYIWVYDRTGQVPGQQPTSLEPIGP